MTLLSTITNDEINKNLKDRFFNQEIYVSRDRRHEVNMLTADIYRSRLNFGQPVQRWVPARLISWRAQCHSSC